MTRQRWLLVLIVALRMEGVRHMLFGTTYAVLHLLGILADPQWARIPLAFLCLALAEILWWIREETP